MVQNWRREYPVLVSEAHTLGSIAVIRSLGRAGYPVHSCSVSPSALGFESRYNAARAISPDYGDPAFVDWLLDYVRAHQIRAIVPSEGLLIAIRPRFAEFSSLLPYPPSERVVYAAMSKADQIEILTNGQQALHSGKHIPPFLLLTDSARPPDEKDLARLGLPLYIKVDACHAKGKADSAVYKAATTQEAQRKMEALISRYRRVLIEGHVPGKGVGAFFLLWDGKLCAEFMHVRLHEVPHTGGVSSYRKVWRHEAVRSDAFAKLNAMSWQGVAMMEYRWNPQTDEFYFMEMNGRFWGSLHLALFAGVDFPALLLDRFHGHPRQLRESQRRLGCRYTFPREAMYVWSRWKDTRRWSVRFAVLLEFLALSLNPRVRSDLWFPGDRLLYWKELWRFLKEIPDALLRRRLFRKAFSAAPS
jgi:hypothetical protein